jgi:hypothetical protein
VSFGFPLGEEYALQRVIVGFTSPAGEHNLARLTPEQRGDLRACFFEDMFCGLPSPVLTGRIAEWFSPDIPAWPPPPRRQ